MGLDDSGGDSVTSGRASNRRKRKVDFMKQNRIVLGVAALVAAVMLPWPALGQEVGQQTVPGKESPAEKTDEKESEKPADKAAERQASDKKTDGDWGFRWDGRPSLHLGEGTRVDFRVRLQNEIWHSDATLSLDDDSDVATTTSMPMSLAGASVSRAKSSTSSTTRSSESSRPTEIPGATSI